MSDLELCYLPATEALQRFRSKTLSPVELLDAMLQRIEETEPVINALTFKHFDEARDRAKKAESKVVAKPAISKPEPRPVRSKPVQVAPPSP